MISYVIPTRNRPQRLAATLDAVGRLGDHAGVGGAEVVIADNASDPPAWAPQWLASGIPVKLLRRDHNEGAAARNAAARATDPDSAWLVMLDDDSYPLDGGVLEAVASAPGDMAAVAAEIFLPAREEPGATLGVGPRTPPTTLVGPANPLPSPGVHESGGLPEVFIGCGVAIRREVFLKSGGYDPTFDYYAEEYDLAARLMAAGYRVGFDRRFRVMHHKVEEGRDFGRIVHRLVRNNAWVAQRYAPDDRRSAEIRETVLRYGRIAWKERSTVGYLRGLWELTGTLGRQARAPVSTEMWDRLTGLHHARVAISAADAQEPLGRVALVDRGKNAWAVERALAELGVRVIPDQRAAQTLVIATMSPGPMLDALARWRRLSCRIVAPWVEATRGQSRAARPGVVAA